MAVPVQTPFVEYIANGVTTNFPLGFDCETQSHLIVTVDDIEPITGSWSLLGGAVVFNSAPINGSKIIIKRNSPFERDRDFQLYDQSFRPPAVNLDLDRIWRKLQELGVMDWILGNRIDDLKNYVDDRDDELRAYLLEEIRKQGVALDQLEDYYNYLMQRLAEIAVNGGWESSFVSYGNINQKKYNDGVESIAELLTISSPFDGMRVPVKSYLAPNFALAIPFRGGDDFVYKSNLSTTNNGITIINGWVKQTITKLSPHHAGIVEQDNVTINNTKWNTLFNLDIPVHIPKGDWYCNGGKIELQDKNLNVSGDGKNDSKLYFTTLGHGVHQKTTTGAHTFELEGFSIVTTKLATGNGSGFFYDASQYLATLTISPETGYKILGNRALNRGKIKDFCTRGEFLESVYGWKQGLEFLGCMNFTVDELVMHCPTDFSGDGCWIHGDGMIVDFRFSNVYSYYGNRVFRLNDYHEGFHLTDFELINCKQGLVSLPDADTQVTSTVKANTWYISDGHIFSYINCIASSFLSSPKLNDLELYLFPKETQFTGTVPQAVTITTCDSLSFYDSVISLINTDYTTVFGLQIGTGWGNHVHDITFKGEPWTYVAAFGTSSNFYGNEIKGMIIDECLNGLYFNEANCYKNDVEAPIIITSTTSAVNTSSDFMSKNDLTFRKFSKSQTYSYNGASGTITIDVSAFGFTQKPIYLEVYELGTNIGDVLYGYRSDVSTKDSVTIQYTTPNGSATAGNKTIFINAYGV
ncbi:hypothetical protein ABTO03_03010 [Acinetobacter baumannii]|uniref:hypothetical protein n=1 Tax=Acinetobacter baumannii TaxID=470 RepID=UPI0037BE0538